jgi:energy-coupling factor transporter ATP-binding protein EcfA2
MYQVEFTPTAAASPALSLHEHLVVYRKSLPPKNYSCVNRRTWRTPPQRPLNRRRAIAADSHAWIRVQGAREHNLKNVSVDLPKRRLTVFTGVSGSGKSSLVFATIAAESQRLINETYSAFVQGFMPTMARPEVDLLDGLTTAIIVDQERMGANPRSTVGTATDANAMLRLLFSRLGQPHIGPSNAFSFNVPSVRASGTITVERGARTAASLPAEGEHRHYGGTVTVEREAGKTEQRSFTVNGGHVPALRGAWGRSATST